ncbi:MAG: hypothetical protein ACE5JQ_07715 [Candidatus Methylomirabilales bacterium]
MIDLHAFPPAKDAQSIVRPSWHGNGLFQKFIGTLTAWVNFTDRSLAVLAGRGMAGRFVENERGKILPRWTPARRGNPASVTGYSAFKQSYVSLRTSDRFISTADGL